MRELVDDLRVRANQTWHDYPERTIEWRAADALEHLAGPAVNNNAHQGRAMMLPWFVERDAAYDTVIGRLRAARDQIDAAIKLLEAMKVEPPGLPI